MKAIVPVVLLLAAAPAQAVDAVYAEAGAGNSVYIARAGMVWKWVRAWSLGDRWQVSGAWEAAIGEMRGDKPGQNAQFVTDVGITPVFRLARAGEPDLPYIEGGFVGLHLFSKAFIYEGKKFGSAFQFGNFVGVGMHFGDRRQYSVSYRLEHMSNAGIVQPNQGLNLSEFHIAYFF